MSMNITLRQIRAFVAVAEHGRFALAADRLNVTPSALSMLVRQLEGELGARLFDRHTRLVRLTEVGAEFLPVARKTLADLENALSRSRDLASLRRGRVSLATSTVLAATLLPWAIRRFCREHAGITFVLKDVAEPEIQQRVGAGDVDLGVGTALDPDPELDEAPLLEDRLVALLPRDHPLAGRREVAWREIAAEPMIYLGSGSPPRTLVERTLRSLGIEPAPAYEVAFSSTAISMVASGLGVAALPVNARQLSPKVNVVMRPLVRPVVPRRVCVFKRRDTGLAPAAAAFRAFLHDYVRAGGYPAVAPAMAAAAGRTRGSHRNRHEEPSRASP